MAMLQQLQHEVTALKMDVERLQGGAVGKSMEEMPSLPAVLPMIQPAVENVAPAEHAVVEVEHEHQVEESEAIDVDVDTEYVEDFSIPNATDNLIRRALKKYSNKKEAAEALEISERTLYRKIKELGLED